MIHGSIEQLIDHRSALPGVDRTLHAMIKRGLTLHQAFEAAGIEVRDKAYPTRGDDRRQFEVHDRTIDLMVALEGEEVVHVCPAAELQPGMPLPDGADGRKLSGAPRGMAVPLKAGQFAAFFPGEAHMVAGHPAQGPGAIHKLVIKLPAAPLRKEDCPCPDDCVRHGICAECVAWHQDPDNSLPTCLRPKGRAMVEKALAEQALRSGQ